MFAWSDIAQHSSETVGKAPPPTSSLCFKRQVCSDTCVCTCAYIWHACVFCACVYINASVKICAFLYVLVLVNVNVYTSI